MSLWWTVQLVSADPEDLGLRETRRDVHAPSATLAAEECVRTWLDEEAPPNRAVCLVVEVSLAGESAVSARRRVNARLAWRTWSEEETSA